jgi:hypothetical protein
MLVVTLVVFTVHWSLVMFIVALVMFTDLVALTFSFPAKATLNESAKRTAINTINPTFVEFFICVPLIFPDGNLFRYKGS